jgi:hypothetical protein
MNLSFRHSLLALTLTALPVLAMAAPESRSLKACTQAFAAAIAAGTSASPSYRVAYSSESPASPLAYYPLSYSFDLQAQKPGTGEIMARASCTASRTGANVSIRTLPLDLMATLPAARL